MVKLLFTALSFVIFITVITTWREDETATTTTTEGTKEAKKEPIKEETIKEEPMKEETIKEEPMKEEPKKKEPMKEEPMKEEPIKEEPMKEEPMKEEPIKEEPMKEEPIKEEPMKEEPIKEEPIKEEPKKEPDTPALLYWKSRGGLFLVPEGDKNKEIPLAGGRARYGKISPDGSKVVFQAYDGDREIYLVNLKGVMFGGLLVKKLTNNSEDDQYPTWSPDGEEIAFVKEHDHDKYLGHGVSHSILYTMKADGSEEEKIRHFNHYVAHLNWHPKDKNRILFENNMQLHTINSSGGDLKQITAENRYYTTPSWSNDGKSIVARNLMDHAMDILNANGSLKRRIAYDPIYPQFSPDNNELVFRRSGSYDIDYVNADESNYQESNFKGNPSDWGLIHWGN